MKKRYCKSILIFLCVVALVLVSAFSVYALDSQYIVTDETEIDIAISEDRYSYIYLSASAPGEWSGEIQISFHSLQTGKEESVTMNYLLDGYHSGIWLPFGTYRLTLSQPYEDGLCTLEFSDPTQETIQVRKGENTTVEILVKESESSVPVLPSEMPEIVAPDPDETYQDLPTSPVQEDTLEETESSQEAEIVIVEDHTRAVIRIVATVLVVIILIAAAATFAKEYRESNSDE